MKTLMKNAVTACIVLIAWVNVVGQTVEKWLPLSSTNEVAVNAYHDALIRGGHYDQIGFKTKLAEAIKADPQFFMAKAVHAWMNPNEIEGVLNMPTEKLTKSEIMMRDVLKLLQNNPSADFFPLATALTHEFPKTMEAYIFANHMMFKNNDWKNAMKFSKKMTELDPSFPIGYHWLGYAYLFTGYTDLAGKMFEKYAATAPKEAKPYDALGQYYMTIGEFDKSAMNYEKAVAMGLNDSKFYAEKSRSIQKGLEFSADQKAVWQIVEDTWKYIKEKNIPEFSKRIHDNYLGWNNLSSTPWTKADFTLQVENSILESYKIKPISVAITGNTAVVDYLILQANYQGFKSTGKNAEFYIKENGNWILIGDNTYIEEVKEQTPPEI